MVVPAVVLAQPHASGSNKTGQVVGVDTMTLGDHFDVFS
jgi:hypothetical protein